MTPVRIHEKKLWTGSLADLGRFLRAEVAKDPPPADDKPGAWHWRQLPRGAVVGFRRDPDGRIRCHIGRPQPGNPLRLEAGRPKWRQELAVFIHHLKLGDWLELPEDEPKWSADLVEPTATQLTLDTERQA